MKVRPNRHLNSMIVLATGSSGSTTLRWLCPGRARQPAGRRATCESKQLERWSFRSAILTHIASPSARSPNPSIEPAPKNKSLARSCKTATGDRCYRSTARRVPGNADMKCSNASCNHDIGLVSYRRGWFDKRRFCSKRCRDGFKIERPEPDIKNSTVADERTFCCPCCQ